MIIKVFIIKLSINVKCQVKTLRGETNKKQEHFHSWPVALNALRCKLDHLSNKISRLPKRDSLQWITVMLFVTVCRL